MKRIVTLLICMASYNVIVAQNENLNADAATINNEFHALVKNMPSPTEELEDLHHDKAKFKIGRAHV